MRIRCTFPGYSCEAHDDTLAQWEVQRHLSGPLELDLTACRSIDAYGIVALVLFINSLPPAALPVTLHLDHFPDGPLNLEDPQGPLDYLTRMGFWEEVGSKLSIPQRRLPARPLWSDDKNVLIDVTILHSRDAIHVLLRRMGEILQHLNYSPIGRGHVMEVMSELSSNVMDHAQADYGGVVTTQTHTHRDGGRYLVLSIGDDGMGVRRSLAANLALADRLGSDAQALGVAVQPGSSRFGTGGRGGGLPRVLDIARRYGGNVVFRSGTGALGYRGRTNERNFFDTPPMNGTQLRIMLPESRIQD